MARPRANWDGKIGCWEIVETARAQRNSANRPAGTTIIRPVTVAREVYRDFLVNKVIPAVKDKWIWPAGIVHEEILIQ